ncbi:MAG TPA: VanZ family protein [Thermoanaerobaculia bacterium]|jgi:glycopeptide antibiotics resistance protein
MGKREVRVIVVSKVATAALWIVVSAGIAALVWFLSGKAYSTDVHPVREILGRLLGSRALSRDALLAYLMPTAGNALLFLPWGFLLFLALDTPSRPRFRSYAITLVGGVLFSSALQLWQEFLPTRVTGMADGLANVAGALTGAALGHMRKQVHVRFDF